MRFAEIWNILFFSCMIVLACFLPLPLQRRIAACVIGVGGITLWILASLSGHVLTESASLIFRDWLAAPLMLAAYHQAGQLFTKPLPRFQTLLMNWDRRLLGRFAEHSEERKLSPFWSVYFEISYVLCYPLIPAALGALYLLQKENCAEDFWIAVLVPTYLCYALVPLLPALPPRLLGNESGTGVRDGKVRALNLWLLRHGGIGANTFPSAHVTACIAASLMVLRHDFAIGICFLWLALSIAVAVVVLRYHYTADAVLGIALPLALFIILK